MLSAQYTGCVVAQGRGLSPVRLLQQMSGTELGTAADQNETEAQSAAAEEMNLKVLDTGRKVLSLSCPLRRLPRAQVLERQNEGELVSCVDGP